MFVVFVVVLLLFVGLYICAARNRRGSKPRGILALVKAQRESYQLHIRKLAANYKPRYNQVLPDHWRREPNLLTDLSFKKSPVCKNLSNALLILYHRIWHVHVPYCSCKVFLTHYSWMTRIIRYWLLQFHKKGIIHSEKKTMTCT